MIFFQKCYLFFICDVFISLTFYENGMKKRIIYKEMNKMLPNSKTLWRYRRLILAFQLSLFLSPILFFTMDRAKDIIEDLSHTNRLVRNSLKDNVKRETIRSCNIPPLDSFAEDVEKSTDKPIVTCEGTDWVNCFKSECSVAKVILRSVKDIVCVYSDIIYIDDRNFYFGHPSKVIGDVNFSLNNSDHVKIDCTGKDMNSPEVQAYWSGFKAGFRPISTESSSTKQSNHFNVMILCFDSTTRNGFIRKMRNSYKYLTEKLNAVVLNSYNIVGDGSDGALYPILTGKPEKEHNQRKRGKKKYIDPKKFIFHMLKEHGYRTAYFEDKSWTGTAQYTFNWFRSQPADHYLRAMQLADTRGNENQHQGRPIGHCFGSIPQYQLLMNLADEFLQLDGKKFCFTLIVDMMYENFTVVPTPDEILLSYLQILSARRALEDTLILVLGNHGSRFSATRGTSQGSLEERLPFMAILLPEKLKKLRPTTFLSLKNNVNVLTTPFDIHATILDVLDLKEKGTPRLIPGSGLPRAMSLLEPIPKSRSCGEAGVMPHWCACTYWSNVSRTSPMYNQVANVLAD